MHTYAAALALYFIVSLSGCGVKGDPLPPERPTEIGRGRPTYRRAAEKIRIEPRSKTDADDEEEDK